MASVVHKNCNTENSHKTEKGKTTTEQALVSAPERDKRYTGSEQNSPFCVILKNILPVSTLITKHA